jgi:hypothetical protein
MMEPRWLRGCRACGKERAPKSLRQPGMDMYLLQASATVRNPIHRLPSRLEPNPKKSSLFPRARPRPLKTELSRRCPVATVPNSRRLVPNPQLFLRRDVIRSAVQYMGRNNSAGPGNVQPRQLFCGSYVAATHILSASTGDIFFSLTRNASINGTG